MVRAVGKTCKARACASWMDSGCVHTTRAPSVLLATRPVSGRGMWPCYYLLVAGRHAHLIHFTASCLRTTLRSTVPKNNANLNLHI